MQVGAYNAVIRTPDDTRPLVELYAEAVDRAVAAEEFGFDFMWVSEHHFKEDQWNPSPLILLGGFATRTSRLGLGTYVLLTPFYNPVRLAEDLATLDLLSNGRINLVAGSASITGEFETFGIDPATRFGRVWETLGFLRRAFSEPRFDHQGRYYTFPNVRMTTQPVQQPFPLWFGGFGPKMLHRAGLEGYNLQATMGAGREQGPYLDGLRQGGHDPDSLNLALSVTATVLATQRDVDEERERIEAEARRHNAEYSQTGRDLAFQNIAPNHRPPLIGTPDQVLAEFEPELKHSRATHVIFTGRRSRKELELIAKEIVPTLQTWGRTPVQAQRVPA